MSHLVGDAESEIAVDVGIGADLGARHSDERTDQGLALLVDHLAATHHIGPCSEREQGCGDQSRAGQKLFLHKVWI